MCWPQPCGPCRPSWWKTISWPQPTGSCRSAGTLFNSCEILSRLHNRCRLLKMWMHWSCRVIEEGWREKQRQRSLRLFGGKNLLNSLPRSLFYLGRFGRNDWIQPILSTRPRCVCRVVDHSWIFVYKYNFLSVELNMTIWRFSNQKMQKSIVGHS